MLVRITGPSSNPAKVSKALDTPVANTAAVIIIAAVASKTTTIHGIQWSYSTSPTGGNLLVQSNGVTIWSADITAGGPGGFNFDLPGTPNKNVVVTLASGTGACVGKLNVQYVTEP